MLQRILPGVKEPIHDRPPCLAAAVGIENLRHERTQLFHTVRAGQRYHDGNAARAQVLLKREVPIDREKRLEVLGNHELQEFTVALGRWPRRGRRRNLEYRLLQHAARKDR
jgi:hypothetical protein